MLQIFKEQPSTRNIFQEFEYMDYREDWLMTQRNMARMYKQNYSNMGGYYGGYGYMPVHMNYMYPGYSGIPGVGYNKDYYEGNGENIKDFKNEKHLFEGKNEEDEEKN